MVAVADVMNRAARECRITPTSGWVGATQLSHIEFKDFLGDTVDELADRLDWPAPITVDLTLTGTAAETYSLPPDFKRLTRDALAVYEKTTTRRACLPISTNGEWTYLKQIGSAGGSRYYFVSGYDGAFSISFYRPLEPGNTVTLSYVSRNWLSSGGTVGTDWETDDDILLWPADLVRMGVIWRWRKAKGLPFADNVAEFEARLSRLINDARGVRSINFGDCVRMRSPFDIPVPDFIPPG